MITTLLKYLINSDDNPLLYSNEVNYSITNNEVKSAGFLEVYYNAETKKYSVHCFGENTLLNRKANPIEDKATIESYLNV